MSAPGECHAILCPRAAQSIKKVDLASLEAVPQ